MEPGGQASPGPPGTTRWFSDEAEREFEKAHRANGVSDHYVMLTVLFLMAMFFAGVGPQFEERRIRTVLVAIGGASLALSLAILASYSVARPG